MRCKFEVISKTQYAGIPSIRIELHPTMGNSEEDRRFWKATPSGKLEMMIENPDAKSFFEVGKEYYLDFTEAIID